MKIPRNTLTIVAAILITMLNHASGQTPQPTAAHALTADNVSKVVVKDRSTGRAHTITKDGHLWRGTHPAFDGYGLTMRRSRYNPNPGHILELY